MNTNAPVTLTTVIVNLFDLCRAGLPGNIGSLADRLGLDAARLVRALGRLEVAGLVRIVDGEARLTMSGLAIACAEDASREHSTRATFALAA